jgi:hypothetical protein
MELLTQAYLFRETTLANGLSYRVNYIVRKTPFEIILGGPSSFSSQKLDCSLLYHQTNKLVDANNGPAMDYVCSPLDSSTHHTCAVSFRINVLSTQHSNSLFVIRFQFGHEVVFSEPIRSVSKPEQIRKKIAQCDPADYSVDDTKPSTKKRARSEELLETLATIQQEQQEQTALISSLLAQKPTANNNYNRPASLEDSLKSLIANFEDEEVEQRPTKIGRFITSLDDDTKKVLANLGHFLVNLTQPTHYQSMPPSPFSSPVENLNILGDAFTSAFTSDDEYSSNGMNEDANFPESYLNWFV